MGVATWDRDTGGWSDEFDDSGKIKRKPIADIDRDVHVPVDEIDDQDSDKPKPEIDIEDDGNDLNIVPVTPNTGTDKDDDVVIREEIIRRGILDNPKNPGDDDKGTKGKVEIN